MTRSSFASWLKRASGHAAQSPRGAGRDNRLQRRRCRPCLDELECRNLPSPLTVLNNADSGPGSLRDIIAAANSGDAIVFDPGLQGQTITLTSGELTITKSLDIQGLGADQLTVSGNGACRVFDLTGSEADVTIAGLTIAHGMADAGAGIDSVSGTLTVSGDNFLDNQAVGAPGGPGQGGGIFNGAGATLLVRHSTFADNLAKAGEADADGNTDVAVGGAIDNEGVATVLDSAFTANQAMGSDSAPGGVSGVAQGGAIWNFGALEVNDSDFMDNQATAGRHGRVGAFPFLGNGGGGGIDNQATLTVSHSVFAHNGAFGGAAYDGVAGGAGNGGGIASSAPPDAPEGASAAVSDSTFFDNQTAGGPGGAGATGGSGGSGALLNGYGTFTITHSTFHHNEARGGLGGAGGAGGDGRGGAILNSARDGDSAMTLSHSTLTDNRAMGGAAGAGGAAGTGSGGGIANIISTAGLSASVTVTHSTLNDNQALGGAGVSGGTGQGGGLANLGGPGPGVATLTVSDTWIAGNEALGAPGSAGGDGGNGRGGGLFVASGTVSLEDTLITDNQASGGSGGGGTDGQGVGGGVYIAAGSVCVWHSHITGNHASTSDDDVFGVLGSC